MESGILLERASGILLHPTSLPGPGWCGDLGAGARRFVDFLAAAGQRIWQVLPVGPPGYGATPYQTLSARAGGTHLIAPDLLFEEGWIDRSTAEGPRETALWRAFEASERDEPAEFHAFCRAEAAWLEDWTLFAVIKGRSRGAPWPAWEEALRRRDPAALDQVRAAEAQQLRFEAFLQWQFRRQWASLRRYANDRGVHLLGDLPIFVALDSADVWSARRVFRVDPDGRPEEVAGVPPDYFSKDGQLWGNPLYDWQALEASGFDWWLDRLGAAFALFDAVRIDHFIGFHRAWAVPSGAETARNGRWVLTPGEALFRAALARWGALPIVAEDLGFLIDEVRALRDRLGFPGMKVLQFAFGSGDGNEHLPHHYPRRSVVYTGTHDNNTTVGWWRRRPAGGETAEMIAEARAHCIRYLGLGRAPAQIHWEMIRLAWSSIANTAIAPMQDVLGLGAAARMNTPGRKRGNWSFRIEGAALDPALAERLRVLTETYGRQRSA